MIGFDWLLRYAYQVYHWIFDFGFWNADWGLYHYPWLCVLANR